MTVRIWDIATQREQAVFGGHTQAVVAVAFSPNRSMIATADDGVADDTPTIRVWSVESGEKLSEFDGHLKRVPSVTFSPDGQTLASVDYGGIVKLWSVATGERLPKSFQAPVGGDLSFSQNGQMLALEWGGTMTTIWNVENGTVLRTMEGLDTTEFSYNGASVSARKSKGHLRLWDTKKGTELAKIRVPWEVTFVAVAPSNQIVAAGCTDGSVRLWRAADDDEVRSLGWFDERVLTHQ